VNHYGEGKFLTLNFPFQQLPALSADSSLSKTIEPLFGSLPAHTTFANAETGKKVYNLRRVVWKNGDMRIMGIKNLTGGKRACRATLPKEEYVFNLNTEKALGKVSSFDFTIDPPMPEFFILTDRPLPEVTYSVPKSAKRGSTISITYSVRGMKGERPLLLSFEKDGKVLDLYTKVEVCANTDKRETRFRIALNDSPGKYAIVARDVYTGGTEKFQLTVE